MKEENTPPNEKHTWCFSRRILRYGLVVLAWILLTMTKPSEFNMMAKIDMMPSVPASTSGEIRSGKPHKTIQNLTKTFQPVPFQMPIQHPFKTSRLARLSDLKQFPTPQFHGCNSRGLCHFENVCYSSRDGLLVMKTQKFQQTNIKWVSTLSRQITQPRQPIIVPPKVYGKFENVWFANSIFTGNCWRQKVSKANPAHMLMGMGKLFVASTGYYTGGSFAARVRDTNTTENNPKDLKVDLVLFHHCSNPNNWPWGQALDTILWNEALKSGIINNNSVPHAADAKFLMPYKPKKGFPQKDDLIVCGKTVYQEPFSVALYLGDNAKPVVQKWKEILPKYFNAPNNEVLVKESRNLLDKDSQVIQCARSLRFGIWNRTEGSALRLFRNLDEVHNLVCEYSDTQIKILDATSKTKPQKQYEIFNSFDVLITSHGSHLANMLLNSENPGPVYIELQLREGDVAPLENGQAFAREWIFSIGHSPYKASVKDVQRLQELRANPSMATQKDRLNFLQKDIWVNTTLLRENIEQAITSWCGPQSIQPKPCTNKK